MGFDLTGQSSRTCSLEARLSWFGITRCVAFLIACFPGVGADHSTMAQDSMVRAIGGGMDVVGKPLAVTASEVLILGRDGRLFSLANADLKQAAAVPQAFQPYSAAEQRGALLKEFGKGFDVSGTGHFLVVHPAGQQDRWAQRFEDLYRRMAHYFAVRGIPMREPTFPLVAIVLNTQGDFVDYARRNGRRVGKDILGYYDPLTNRIVMYDVTAGGRVAVQWDVNAATVVHEAAHQTAFNAGLHNRFSPTPRWLSEGLGTLFEARGVFDARSYPQFADRVNGEQLATWKHLYPGAIPRQTLAGLLASDHLFDADPQRAYALGWGLTFMLAEQEPRKLARYLALTASHRAFEEVTPAARLADFTGVFGDQLSTLDARLERYLSAIR